MGELDRPSTPLPPRSSSTEATTTTTMDAKVAAAAAVAVEDLGDGFDQLLEHNNAMAAAAGYGAHDLEQQQQPQYAEPPSRYASPPLYGQHHQHAAYVGGGGGGGEQPPPPPYSAYSLDPSPYPQLPDLTTHVSCSSPAPSPSCPPAAAAIVPVIKTEPAAEDDEGPTRLTAASSSSTRQTPQQHHVYTPAATPPPPLTPEGGMKTRSGRSVNNAARPGALGPQHHARVEKATTTTPRARKAGSRRKGGSAATKAGAAADEVILERPLSELVAGITCVADTDIEAYVHRATDARRAEVANSKDGKIRRPMNAFMLYRKAFQNRTKEWKKHDNHQVISRLCGASWNMEGDALRARFDGWAQMERDNHRLAFPDYKFAPAKAKKLRPAVGLGGGGGGGGRQTRGRAHESDDNNSNLDDYDWAASQAAMARISEPPSRTASRATMYPHHPGEVETYMWPPAGYEASPPPHMYPAAPPPMPAHHQSSFQYSNPGKPRPANYGAGLAAGQYYQQSAEFARTAGYPHPHPHHQRYGSTPPPHPHQLNIQDVYMAKANSPAAIAAAAAAAYGAHYAGAPMQMHPQHHQGSPLDHYAAMMGSGFMPPPPAALPHEHQIDPSLMAPHTNPHDHDSLSGILGLDGQGSGDFGLDDQAPPPMYQHETPGADDQHHHHGTPVWHEDEVDPTVPSMADPSISSEWAKFEKGGEYDIDGLLGTTDSPGA
ncbi:hypothetical protein F4780DRAFT_774939 [Xylariomycetidae sp. FL0641]|nr:hypothetical protein F4780DRAFT_774939 [Xylariomycetidae sp. FL0641]